MSDERVIPGKTGIGNVCRHIARYNMALTECDGKKVLDVACGSGYGSKILGMVAKEVIGWDIDKKTIDYAKANYGSQNISYYVQDLENIDFDKVNEKGLVGKLDVIVSFETLEHLNDPKKVLRDYKKLLDINGMLIATVPLNETEGQNEHHKHTYNIHQARELFRDFATLNELIQNQLSWYPVHPGIYSEPLCQYLFVGRP